jgi:hypothetical protein
MSEDDEGTNPADRLIYDAREQLQLVRNEFWRQRVRGTVSSKMKRELAVAAIQLHDVLWEHSDENAIEDEWDGSNVDDLRTLLDKTVSVPEQTPGDSANNRTVERPAIAAVDGDWLVDVSKRLERLAKQLGFGANTRDETPHNEPSAEDLRGLVELRGQDEAADNIKHIGNSEADD